ncbi:uncharacterized protein LOC122260615 [Penaeus japonicus]|uniref:uncharacterized protein LOC122260615 n=1 Tax=Penaeus japonicus TaxID=27405 RepID=UPI001C716AD7|nr:uncharacterized protein LOC122260615 [Penaeus japonicus]
MKTLSLLALLVGAVAIAEGYPSEEKHVEITNSRQKRDMHDEVMDLESMGGGPGADMVIMVQQLVNSNGCCKTNSCGSNCDGDTHHEEGGEEGGEGEVETTTVQETDPPVTEP